MHKKVFVILLSVAAVIITGCVSNQSSESEAINVGQLSKQEKKVRKFCPIIVRDSYRLDGICV